MPKTKDAFALHDFDTNHFFFREGLLKSDRFFILEDFWTCDTDKEFINFIHFIIDALLGANEYGRANCFVTYMKEIDRDLLTYSKRIKRHCLRLNELSSRIRQAFLDEKIPVELIRTKMRRLDALIVSYQAIDKDAQSLREYLTALISQVEYQLREQYRGTFSKRLRLARRNAKLTQTRMADALGISVAAYTRYENNDREPSLANLARIAKILNVSIDWLLGIEKTSEVEPDEVDPKDLPF